jgi:hypothetical protein
VAVKNRFGLMIVAVTLSVSVSACGVKHAEQADMVRKLTEACGPNAPTDCQRVPEDVAKCIAQKLFDKYKNDQSILDNIARSVRTEDVPPEVRTVIADLVASCQENPSSATTTSGPGATTTSTAG